MQSGHRIDADVGYLVGPPTDEAVRELRSHRPPRLELVGERHDLAPFDAVGDAVRVLKLSGSLETGRISSVEGLGIFARLEALEISGKVKGGFDVAALRSLRKADLQWQPEVNDVLAMASLQQLTVRGYAGADLTALRASPTLESLRLATPALQSLQGLEAFARLSQLTLTRARKLQSLQGVQGSALRSLDIDDARALNDLSQVDGLALQRLALISTGSSAALDVVSRLPALRELIVGGKDAPEVDWRSALALPSMRKVAAQWDPALHPEDALRDAVPPGRAMTRFDPVPGKGRRALIVELA